MGTAFGTDPIWFDELNARIRAVVMKATQLPSQHVFEYLGRPEDLTEEPPAEKYASISPDDLPINQPIGVGVPIGWHVFDCRYHIDLFTRVWKDKGKVDANLLNEAGRGLHSLSKSVVKAMEREKLEKTEGQSPLMEPMRLLYPQFNPRRTAPGWAWVRLVHSVKFRANL